MVSVKILNCAGFQVQTYFPIGKDELGLHKELKEPVGEDNTRKGVAIQDTEESKGEQDFVSPKKLHYTFTAYFIDILLL